MASNLSLFFLFSSPLHSPVHTGSFVFAINKKDFVAEKEKNRKQVSKARQNCLGGFIAVADKGKRSRWITDAAVYLI
jgi:two-component SAPR family response regulator